MIQSTVKTKKGNFDISFDILENSRGTYTTNAILEMNGKSFPIENINLNFSDRVSITPEIAKEFGVEFSHSLKLQCDLTPVINAVKDAKREKEARTYDGSIIDSGYGFKMKNTKTNHDLCVRYGYDAIEKIK